ncbi:MAG: DUF2273 domain-containing protein [Peptococcia bacterium]
MWKRLLIEILDKHRGKLVGIVVGFIIAILVLSIGFWRTFFIACCIGVGYIIGKQFDDDQSLRDLIERFFSER